MEPESSRALDSSSPLRVQLHEGMLHTNHDSSTYCITHYSGDAPHIALEVWDVQKMQLLTAQL